LELCRPTGDSAKTTAMKASRNTWLPRVCEQADKCVNESLIDRPTRKQLSWRKPTDRNQLRMLYRREVGYVDHGR